MQKHNLTVRNVLFSPITVLFIILIPIAILTGLLMYWQLRIGVGSGSGDYSQAKIDDASRANSNGWQLGLILVVLSIMFRSWFLSFVTYLPTWIQEQGGALEMGGQLLFVFSAFLGGGSLLGGVLADRIGRWQVLALGLGLLSPSYWFFMNTINSDIDEDIFKYSPVLYGRNIFSWNESNHTDIPLIMYYDISYNNTI